MIKIAFLLLAACINSPHFGKYVTTTPPCYLNSSVASSDSPGSADFNESSHRAFDKTAATAYYAIFDGYYQRANMMETYYYGSLPLLSKNVATNALVDYSSFLSIAANLTNELYCAGDTRVGSAMPNISSSAFLDLYGSTLTNSSDLSTVDLSQWKCLMTIEDLDKGLFTTFPYTTKDTPILYKMCYSACRHEYLSNARTLADDLYDFDYTTPYGINYVDIVNAVFGSYSRINYITSSSYALSWKPLAAVSQALSLLDMQYEEYGNSGIPEYLWTNTVINTYWKEFSSELGSCNVVVDENGNVSFSQSPIPLPHGTPDEDEGSSTRYAAEDFQTVYYHLLVDECSSGNVQVHGSYPLERVTAAFDMKDFMESRAYWGIITVPWTGMVQCVTRYEYDNQYKGMRFDTDVLLNGVWYESTEQNFTEFDPQGTYQIDLSAECRASYYKLQPTSTKKKRDNYTPSFTNATHQDIFVASCACTTNYNSRLLEFGDYVDFGYYPPQAKPSPRDESQRWKYIVGMGNVYGNTESGAVAARKDVNDSINNTLTPYLIADMKGIAGGDFDTPSDYIDFTLSDFNDLIDNVSSVSLSMDVAYGTDTNEVQVIVTANETGLVVTPEYLTLGNRLGIRANGTSTNKKKIHPTVYGDIKSGMATRHYYNFTSLNFY